MISELSPVPPTVQKNNILHSQIFCALVAPKITRYNANTVLIGIMVARFKPRPGSVIICSLPHFLLFGVYYWRRLHILSTQIQNSS